VTKITATNLIDAILKPIDIVSDTLERKLGLFSVVIISLSAMLGSGLFVLPALVMLDLGGGAAPVAGIWLAYLIAAFAIMPAAFSKGELATAMPASGGSYIYIERTFGPLVGTIAGIGLWSASMLKSAFALIGFKAYLWVLEELLNVSINLEVSALILLTLIVIINILGVSRIKKVQTPIVLALVAFMFILSIWAILTMEMNWSAAFSKDAFGASWQDVAHSAGLVFVAYAGVTKVAAVGGEIKNPSRNIPYGIILSLIIACVLYVFVAIVMVATVDPTGYINADGTAREDPLYVLSHAIGGSTVGVFSAVFAITVLTATALSGIMATSRFPFAMARDNLLPAALENVHRKFKTPHLSIIGTGVAMAISLIFLPVSDVIKLASGFKILIFIVINACVIVLRSSSKHHRWYNPEWKSPLYPYMQILGIISGIILLIMMGSKAYLGGLFAIILGIAIYKTYGKGHINPEITPWETFRMMLTNRDVIEHRRIFAAFNAADVENNKSLNLIEFMSAISALGLGFDEHSTLREYFHRADVDRDGTINVDEFMRFIGIIEEEE